jgi:hypothetical protein
LSILTSKKKTTTGDEQKLSKIDESDNDDEVNSQGHTEYNLFDQNYDYNRVSEIINTDAQLIIDCIEKLTTHINEYADVIQADISGITDEKDKLTAEGKNTMRKAEINELNNAINALNSLRYPLKIPLVPEVTPPTKSTSVFGDMFSTKTERSDAVRSQNALKYFESHIEKINAKILGLKKSITEHEEKELKRSILENEEKVPHLDLTKTSTNDQTYKIVEEEKSKDPNTAKHYGKFIMDGMKDGVKMPYYGYQYLKNKMYSEKIEMKLNNQKQEAQDAYVTEQSNLTSAIENGRNTNENTTIHNQEEQLPEQTQSHLEYVSHGVKYICASALLMALAAISHGFINGGSDYHHDQF